MALSLASDGLFPQKVVYPSDTLVCRHVDVVSYLLQMGADPLVPDKVHSRTCLHYAAWNGESAALADLIGLELKRKQHIDRLIRQKSPTRCRRIVSNVAKSEGTTLQDGQTAYMSCYPRIAECGGTMVSSVAPTKP